jgi:CRP/FNR family transcriptional regulator, anaerobic regulatory protein
MLQNHQAATEKTVNEIFVPMSRSDIAAYIGVSLESVSRSFRILADRGIIALRNRQHVKIIDRAGFQSLIAQN